MDAVAHQEDAKLSTSACWPDPLHLPNFSFEMDFPGFLPSFHLLIPQLEGTVRGSMGMILLFLVDGSSKSALIWDFHHCILRRLAFWETHSIISTCGAQNIRFQDHFSF